MLKMCFCGGISVMAMGGTYPGDMDRSLLSFPKLLQLNVVTLANSRLMSVRMKVYCYVIEFGRCSSFINS